MSRRRYTPEQIISILREAKVEDLRDAANDALGKSQRLAAVEVRDSLPRSPIGKILKRELRAPYWENID